MWLVRELWMRRRLVGCAASMIAASYLFLVELNKVEPKTPEPHVQGEGSAKYGDFFTKYEASQKEDAIVEHVMNQVENFLKKGKLVTEFVDCNLRSWFPRSMHLILTRSLASFAIDDSSPDDPAFPGVRKIVFFCFDQ